MYHETKFDIMIRLPIAPATHHLHIKCKPVIILEISLIIRAECFSLPENISCFNDFDVVNI